MLKSLRRKLSPRHAIYFKLVTWATLLTYLIFLFVFALILAQKSAYLIPTELWGSVIFADVMRWVTPVGIVFTTMLLIIAIMRYAIKKLRVRPINPEREE